MAVPSGTMSWAPAIGFRLMNFGSRSKDGIQWSVNVGKIIADNLSKAGRSWGSVSAVGSIGRTIFIADAHRDGDCKLCAADAEHDSHFDLDKSAPVLQNALKRDLNPARTRFSRQLLSSSDLQSRN